MPHPRRGNLAAGGVLGASHERCSRHFPTETVADARGVELVLWVVHPPALGEDHDSVLDARAAALTSRSRCGAGGRRERERERAVARHLRPRFLTAEVEQGANRGRPRRRSRYIFSRRCGARSTSAARRPGQLLRVKAVGGTFASLQVVELEIQRKTRLLDRRTVLPAPVSSAPVTCSGDVVGAAEVAAGALSLSLIRQEARDVSCSTTAIRSERSGLRSRTRAAGAQAALGVVSASPKRRSARCVAALQAGARRFSSPSRSLAPSRRRQR